MSHINDPVVKNNNEWVSSHLSFTKYHGNGNDFIIFDAISLNPRPLTWVVHQATSLCNRTTGIGADGIIVLTQQKSFIHMDVINADGSIAANCGNGLRCAAEHVFKQQSVNEIVLKLGDRLFNCSRAGEQIHVVMGECTITQIGEVLFRHEGVKARVCEGIIGNRHRVFFLDRAESNLTVLVNELKELYADFADFNNGFVVEYEPGRFFSHVYERGVGFTNACGSGALVAASFVNLLSPWTGERVRIIQPGGELVIGITSKVRHDNRTTFSLTQTGNAQEVFMGICKA